MLCFRNRGKPLEDTTDKSRLIRTPKSKLRSINHLIGAFSTGKKEAEKATTKGDQKKSNERGDDSKDQNGTETKKKKMISVNNKWLIPNETTALYNDMLLMLNKMGIDLDLLHM